MLMGPSGSLISVCPHSRHELCRYVRRNRSSSSELDLSFRAIGNLDTAIDLSRAPRVAKVSRAPIPSILTSAVAVRSKAMTRVLVSTISAARSCLRLVWPAGLEPPGFRLAEKSGRARRLQTPASSHGKAGLIGLGQVLQPVVSSRRVVSF